MKVELGIFQEQDRINEYLEKKGIEHNDILIAGPFATRTQAVEWMDFIEQKLDRGKMVRHSIGLMNQQPWYGVAFAKGRQQNTYSCPFCQTAEVTAGIH